MISFVKLRAHQAFFFLKYQDECFRLLDPAPSVARRIGASLSSRTARSVVFWLGVSSIGQSLVVWKPSGVRVMDRRA